MVFPIRIASNLRIIRTNFPSKTSLPISIEMHSNRRMVMMLHSAGINSIPFMKTKMTSITLKMLKYTLLETISSNSI